MPVSLSTGVTGVLPTFMGGTGNTIAGSIANGTLYIGSGSPGSSIRPLLIPDQIAVGQVML